MELKMGVSLILLVTTVLDKVTGDLMRVCQGETLLLNCNPGHIIYIVYATYGHSDPNFHCGDRKISRISSTNLCTSRWKLPLLKNVCNGKNSCSVNITTSLFGRVCLFKEDEYLDVKYQCSSGQYSVHKRLPKQPELFGRPNFYDSSKQYLGKILVNSSESLTFPLYYHIGPIKRLPDARIDNAAVMRDSLRDLIAKDVKFHGHDGACFNSSDPKSVLYFCSYTLAGYLMMRNNVPEPSFGGIQRYQLHLVMKDSLPSSLPYHGDVITNIVTKCYPVDYLYSQMRKSCHLVSHYYILEMKQRITLPSSFLEVYISDELTLSKLSLFTKFTTPFHAANYSIGIQLKDTLFIQDFEYIENVDDVKYSNLYPKVYGDSFDVTFMKEISVHHSQYIKIYILNHRTRNYVMFSNTSGMILYAINKQHGCPGHNCIEKFQKWKSAYEDLIMLGKVNCVQGYFAAYTTLSFCGDSLYIAHVATHYFGKIIVLHCYGYASEFDDDEDVFWYKDSVLLKDEDDRILQLSGLDFLQEGYYHCQIKDRKGGKITSPQVLIRFQDVIKTLVLWELPTKEYEAAIYHYGFHGFKQQIKSKISKEVSQTNVVVDFEVSMETADKKYLQWVVLNTTIYSQLKHPSSYKEFYNSLSKGSFGLEELGLEYGSVKLLDRDKCLPGVTGISSSYGAFSWSYTSVKESNVIACPYGDATASRICFGEFSTYAIWREPDIELCEFGRNTTKRLNSLLNNINPSTFTKETSAEVKKLTSIQSTITSDDTILVSEIVQKISNLSKTIDLQVAKDVVNIASNMLQVNKSSLVKAQYKKNSLQRIIQAIEDITHGLGKSYNGTEQLTEVASDAIGIALLKELGAGIDTGGVMNVKTKNGSLLSKPFIYQNTTDDSGTLNTSVKIILPPRLFEDAGMKDSREKKSIQFVYYTNDALFPTVHSFQNMEKNQNIALNQRAVGGVFSVKVGNKKSVNLSEPLQYSLKFSPTLRNKSLQCVYWDFNANGKLGGWSTLGCHQVSWERNELTCSCNHLTNFAVLFTPESTYKFPLDKKNALALSIISYIGCSLSLAGISITLVTLLLFRFLRRTTPSKILIGLCSSLGMLLIVFLFLINQARPKWLCTSTAALLQFFILSTFSWMFVEAVTLYLKIVKVMGEYTSHFMIKAASFAIGTPSFIVIVCLSAKLDDYGHRDLCVIRGNVLYYGLFLPTCLIMMFNMVIYVAVINALRKSQTANINKHGESSSPVVQFRIAASCATLLGLSWIFGILAIANARLVFQYLFCIFNSLQGLFIFYFNIFRQQHVRSAWINFLAGRGRHLDMTSNSTLHYRSNRRSTDSTRPTSTLTKSMRENSDSDIGKGGVSPMKKYEHLENSSVRNHTFTLHSFSACEDEKDIITRR